MSTIYAVSEIEHEIITQFGEPVGASVTAAGLKVKVPFIQDVASSNDDKLTVPRNALQHAEDASTRCAEVTTT
jgi:hypothetical protein